MPIYAGYCPLPNSLLYSLSPVVIILLSYHMQMRDVARGVQYINTEQPLSWYLAFPSACLSISALAPPPTKHNQNGLRWKVGN